MRRSIQGAVALLSVLVVAGCSAPSPEPTEAPPQPSFETTPTPTAEPETVGWTLPTTCDDAVWPALQREVDAGAEIVEPLSEGSWMGTAPSSLEGWLGCSSYIPQSDFGRSWAVAQLPVSKRDAALDDVVESGFEIRSDEIVDGVRILRLELSYEPDTEESGIRYEQMLVVGDAWLWAPGNEWFGLEPMRWLASGLGLPIDVDWLLPLGCDDQSEAWPFLAEGDRSGDTSLRASTESSSGRALGQVEQDTQVTTTECGWAIEPGDGYQFDAELFSTSARVPAEHRPRFIEALVAAGWEVSAESDARIDLILRGERPGAAIFAGGGFVSVEPLGSADTALVEPFARGIRLLG